MRVNWLKVEHCIETLELCSSSNTISVPHKTPEIEVKIRYAFRKRNNRRFLKILGISCVNIVAIVAFAARRLQKKCMDYALGLGYLKFLRQPRLGRASYFLVTLIER